MPSAAALASIFGPFLEIGPCVLLVMACGLLVLAGGRMSRRAIRERCTGRFIAGWALGIVGVCAARIGFASLAFYGSPAMSQGLPDPLSGAPIWRFLRACEAPIALAVGLDLLIALWLRQCCRTRRMCGRSRVFWAICRCRYAVTWSRPAALGLRQRSPTRSFQSGIYHGRCQFPLLSRTRAFSMRPGSGSSARRRRAAAAAQRTTRMRAAGGRRSGFGGRRNRLCAGYLQSPGGASVATRCRAAWKTAQVPAVVSTGDARGRSPSC